MNKNLYTLLTLSSLSVGSAHAAWVWEAFSGAAPSGSSGSFEATPLYANYDTGNGVNGYGWDQSPSGFTWNWATGNGEAITWLQTDASGAGYTYFEVDLDPDNNGILPDSLSINVVFPYGITVRADPGTVLGGIGGGAGLLVSAIGNTFNAQLETYLGDGNPATFTSTDYALFGTPTSTSDSGIADFGTISGSGFYGFSTLGTNQSTHLPFVLSTLVGDPSKALGQQTWTMSDFQQDAPFRFSFDGGVGALAVPPTEPIPEPMSLSLTFVGLLSGLVRRVRGGLF